MVHFPLIISFSNLWAKVFIHVTKNADSLMWKPGDQRHLVASGDVSMVNVILSPLQSEATPVWSYNIVNLRYLDSDDDWDYDYNYYVWISKAIRNKFWKNTTLNHKRKLDLRSSMKLETRSIIHVKIIHELNIPMK